MVSGEFAICETLLAAGFFFFPSPSCARAQQTIGGGKRKDGHRCFIGCVPNHRVVHCIASLPTALYLTTS